METSLNTTPIITIITLCLALVACAPRQPKMKISIPTPEKRLYTLTHRLDLTPPQMEAVRPILEQEHQEKTTIMDSFDPGDRDSMMEGRKKLEDLEWKIIKALSRHLTEDQMHLYSDLLAEEEATMLETMRSQRQGSGPDGRGGKSPRR